MTSVKVSDGTVQEIRRLNRQDRDAAEIARELGLSRMQVTALLAHDQMRAAADEADAALAPVSRDVEEGHNRAEPKVWELGQPARTEAIEPEPVVAELSEDFAEPLTGLYVGDDVDLDTPVTWDPANSRRVQNPHLMIMGESGSGKTYATQCLVAELAHAGIPSIIFDYGQGFGLDDLEDVFKRDFEPREIAIGEKGLALNPLEIGPQDFKGANQVATRLADVFDATFQLGDIQRKVLIDATLNVYRDAGILPDAPATWKNQPPHIGQLRDAIDAVAADKKYANARSAAGLAARLTNFFMLASFTDETWSWDELIGDEGHRVNILQFRGLEGKTQRVMVELLLWHLFFHLKGHGQNPLQVFCVLDEAHHLSFRENGPLSALLREARKFGLGIMFASQQPEDFSQVAYSNSASKLVFQTSDPKLKVSKFLAGKAENFDRPEEVRDTIGTLDRANALFITQNRGRVVHIADFPKRSTLWQRP